MLEVVIMIIIVNIIIIIVQILEMEIIIFKKNETIDYFSVLLFNSIKKISQMI